MQGLVEDLLPLLQPVEEHLRSGQGESGRKIEEKPHLLDGLMQKAQLQVLGAGGQCALEDGAAGEGGEILGAVEVEVVFEGERGSFVLADLELHLLEPAVDQFVEDAVEVDLPDVLLGLQQQRLRLLHLPLHVRHVLLQPLQLLPVLARHPQQLHELLALLHRHFLDQLLGLVFELDQLGLLLHQQLLVGLLFLEHLNEVGRWVEGRISEVGVFG